MKPSPIPARLNPNINISINTLSNPRYAICGRPLRGLLPFVREAVGVPITTVGRPKRAVPPALPPLPPSRLMMLTGEAGGDLLDTDAGDPRCTLLGSMEQSLGPNFDPKTQVPQ